MARTKNPTTKTSTPKTEAAVSSTAPVKETVTVKPEAAEAKPAEAVKAEKKQTVRKSASVKADKAEKTEKTEKPAAKKIASKTRKSAPAVSPVVKKRTPRKPKMVTVDDVVAKISKRIDKDAAKQVAESGKAAIDIKLYGAFEAHMYIEIKDGVVTVAPYDYREKDIEAAVPVDVALAIADRKISVKEAVENGTLYVYGNVQFALLFAKLFK